jgi:hypothetical protein
MLKEWLCVLSYRYFVDMGNTAPLLVFRWLMTPGSMRSETTQDGYAKSSKNPESTNYRYSGWQKD